jgi:hypothetical protein
MLSQSRGMLSQSRGREGRMKGKEEPACKQLFFPLPINRSFFENLLSSYRHHY